MQKAWWVLLVFVACDTPPAKAPEEATSVAVQTAPPGIELHALRVEPCFGERPSPDGGTADTLSDDDKKVVMDLRAEGQKCLANGQLEDETMAGVVAVSAKIGVDGQVASIDVPFACGVSQATLLCMGEQISRARFSAGARLVVLPYRFEPKMRIPLSASSRVGNQTLPDFRIRADEVMERLEPQLSECARKTVAKGPLAPTYGVFSLALDAEGAVASINVEPWQGSQDLLGCTAEVLQAARLPAPPKGAETSHVRITYEPPPGSSKRWTDERQ